MRAARLRSSTSRFHRRGWGLSGSHERRWRGCRRLKLRGVRYRVWLRPFLFLREVGDLVFSLHIGLRSGRSRFASAKSKQTDTSTPRVGWCPAALLLFDEPVSLNHWVSDARDFPPARPPDSPRLRGSIRRYWRRLSFAKGLRERSSSAIAGLLDESSPQRDDDNCMTINHQTE